MATDVLTKNLPNIDPPILSYLAGYIDDPESHLDPNPLILDTVSSLLSSYLQSTSESPQDAAKRVHAVLDEIQKLLPETNEDVDSGEGKSGPLRLEKVVEMRKIGALNTRGTNVLTGGGGGSIDLATGSVARATTIDVKKLEKQEAKTRAKLQKRAQRDLYESSNVVEQAKRAQELANYEEMFTTVNTLETVGSKGKNKDIHLPGIDVSTRGPRSSASFPLALTLSSCFTSSISVPIAFSHRLLSISPLAGGTVSLVETVWASPPCCAILLCVTSPYRNTFPCSTSSKKWSETIRPRWRLC